MTITTTTSLVTLNGDGSNKTWNYSFLIPSAADVTVSTSIGGVTTVIDPALYTITTGNPAGGTVTYPLSGSALANGSTITIERTLPLTQTTELTSQGDFDPAVVEDALDYLTMLVQDLSTHVSGLDAAAIAASAAQVTAAVAAFNNEYLGSLAANPAIGVSGQLYFNSVSKEMRVYNGSAWIVTYNPSTGAVNSFNGRTGAIVPTNGDYSIGQIAGASAVAASGAYADLTGKPTLAAVATSGAYSDLSGTPSLAAVAISGAYLDLSGRPTLGTAAAKNTGGANGVVINDASGYIIGDGRNLTNLPATGIQAPTSSNLSVGWSGYMYNSGGATADGGTIAGSSLYPAIDQTSGATTTAQSGTWRNINGATVSSGVYGLFVRIS